MYVRCVILEGFKSYARRTEVDGFDPQFTAITGLNGSGKSNILDALCFVLGITQLDKIRASHLQELVYKSGQAGVNKCSVTVVFDNRDKQRSPLGYEEYPELTVTRMFVIGGRHKYLINGVNCPAERVQNMFQSVQINIQNPHFLIMQGEITKVLNMKSHEILSMVEEAAGTRLFETKKEQVRRTIEKKDSKLVEIEQIITESIEPAIKKLREERAGYLAFQTVQREFEYYSRLYTALSYVHAERSVTCKRTELADVERERDATRESERDARVRHETCTAELLAFERAREDECGVALREAEASLSTVEKRAALADADARAAQDELRRAERERETIETTIRDDQRAAVDKRAQVERVDKELAEVRTENETAQTAVERADEALRAAQLGLIFQEDQEEESATSEAAAGDKATRGKGQAAKAKAAKPKTVSLDELLRAKEADVKQTETELTRTEMRIKHDESTLLSKRTELKRIESANAEHTAANQRISAELERAEGELKKLRFTEADEQDYSAKQTRVETLSRTADDLAHRVSVVEDSVRDVRFRYTDPSPDFDRRNVHGLVSRLFAMRDARFATALEKIAGARLRNVVVESDSVATQLVQRGQLAERTTFIPLNTVQAGRAITSAQYKRAREEAGGGDGEVFLPLDHIEFDRRHERVMEFVFGGALICRTSELARKLCYSSSVNCTCVSLEGDVFRPDGTMAGGAPERNAQSVLLRANEIRLMEKEASTIRSELEQLHGVLVQKRGVFERFVEARRVRDGKQHELQLLTAVQSTTAFGKLADEVRQLDEALASAQRELNELRAKQKRLAAEKLELERNIANRKQFQDELARKRQKELDAAKRRAADAQKRLATVQRELETLRAEIEQHERDVRENEEALKRVDEKLVEHRVTLERTEKARNEEQAKVTAAKRKVEDIRERLRARNKEIEKRSQEIAAQKKKANEADLKAQELQAKVTRLAKELKDAQNGINEMVAKHAWINEEKAQFGVSKGPFDFAPVGNDVKRAAANLEQLRTQYTKMRKTVNAKAMATLQEKEEKYADLLNKKEQVLRDKSSLQHTIVQLDAQKNAVLRKAHDEVNAHFASIFHTLLPSAKADLTPILADAEDEDDDNVHRSNASRLNREEGSGNKIVGLEFRVGFGETWRTLGELSGGQRSLVALSLVLALLKFKPAPFYILDEIDAALDISHTQNIGAMLRAHFTNSQFIIVSLKDNMFNNANVLFRTRLIDGVSTVTQYVNGTEKSRK